MKGYPHMKLTPLARKVLEATRDHQDHATHDSGIGARAIAHLLWGNCHKAMRAGQYAGRLAREGWMQSKMCWYQGARGHQVYSHTEYFITNKGREAITTKGQT
jgi:hypothetical protein